MTKQFNPVNPVNPVKKYGVRSLLTDPVGDTADKKIPNEPNPDKRTFVSRFTATSNQPIRTTGR